MPRPDATEPDPLRRDGGTDPARPRPRPLQVVTAAVLGFVVGFYLLLNGLVLLSVTEFFGLAGLAVGLVYVVLSAVVVCGGVLALAGRRSTVLRAGALLTAGLAALGLVTALVQGAFSLWSLLLGAGGIGIHLLLNRPPSREFFAARGVR